MGADPSVIVFGPGLPGRSLLRRTLEESLPGVRVIEGDFRTAGERAALERSLVATSSPHVYVAWECDAEQARRQIFHRYARLPQRLAERWWQRYLGDRMAREAPAGEVAPVVRADATRPPPDIVAEVARTLAVRPAAVPRGAPTVLVVDDEPLNVQTVADALEELGCRVLQSTSAAAAITLAERGPIDLLVTDLSMPEIDGIELATRVARLWPDAHVAVITGYADQAMERLLAAPQIDVILSKPVAAADLVALVGELEGGSAREALRRSEERWRQLFDQAPHGIFIADLAGRYTHINEAGCRMLGYARDELVGKNIAELIPPEQVERLWQVRELLRAGGEHVAEWSLRHRDGRLLPVEVSACILPDGHWQGFVRDLSAVKELESLREEWASIIAHDLRQPVNVIGLTIETLFQRRAQAMPEFERRALERIGSSSHRLQRMIDDLLDASRIDARRMVVERADADLAALIRQVVGDLPPEEAGRVRVAVGALPPAWVDADRIVQVLGALLSNAIKYGEPGSEIRIDAQDRGERVEVAVSNHGHGIPADQLPQLFTRFARGRQPHGRGGVGLGLYIARGLIQAHGGDLWLDSTPGATTTFRFSLPHMVAERREALS